jgi:hypothetical protein
VSLSRDPVFSLLKSRFVCGWRDISGEPWAGRSGIHETENPAVFTTNGAGPHNIQMFVLSPDGTVLHCLPGYWDARDLALELQFAEQLNRVWKDAALSPAGKNERFRVMQIQHLYRHPAEMVNRSVMQKFDEQFELKHRPDTSDTILRAGSLQPLFRPVKRRNEPVDFKTTDQILHERMAARPFVPYARFDTAAFVDYGRPKYDKKGDGDEGHGMVTIR